ncbi:MAG: NADH-quinone oxidoreductase subunit L [Lachnospiraceae bacterium]|uniref:NADH-quinone oxidoreductase subunit L n=1 Tax=Candidatus Weimeria bifida TaxID=2599074 RepID=A0A6N7J178_9FIRM|nr:NADH-quinone oxidoreductase subunit L [Candidatus Weimeria bifida]RRF95044.1 MAG: NADH-quinone oxidoreductase subunit L [Lachnospiraceae bacterium]
MTVPIVPFLIIFPMIIAFLMLVIPLNPKANRVRNAIAYISCVAIMAAVGILVAMWIAGGTKPIALYSEGMELADNATIVGEFILMIVVTFLSFKYRKYWICILSIVPTIAITWLEKSGYITKETPRIYIDHLSILMCLIVGVIGSLIVIYAVGYMHGYHHYLHQRVQDRRNYFFMVLFIFLGAMFGFVLSDSLTWIQLFWEITSVCSFLLIGYTREPVAIRNSFRALWMNLLGGCALTIGIIMFAMTTGMNSLAGLVSFAEQAAGTPLGDFAIVPVALIAFAALTKAAQLPFSTWLLGAMVAPTPSSALLHSATMVKAGIYVLFRLSPAMHGTVTGNMVAFVGGFTFLMASFIAIAQSDGKKVLAMSTISNLGLMVACAGMGTPETIWAGIFLMIFHAVSKSLLFQDVGATENSLGSRDIENMHGLLYRLPFLAFCMFIGIAGMFLAPFGMLISKWATLRSSIDENNIIMTFMIIFGSATTSFYWTKWLGKLIAQTNEEPVKDITKPNEKISIAIHAVLMVLLCVLMPILTKTFVEPLLAEMFGKTAEVLPMSILYLLVFIIVFVFVVPVISYEASKKMHANQKLSYMSGINTGKNDGFVDSFGNERRLTLSNYYFANRLGIRKLMVPCQLISMAVLIVMMAMIIGGAF